MPPAHRLRARLVARGAVIASVVSALVLSLTACGSGAKSSSAASRAATGATTPLPGVGRPRITIGDKNFTEQFVLGQLYAQALEARGYLVDLNPNIGPTEVTIQALQSGRLDMYPEYLRNWNTTVAGFAQPFRNRSEAYQAARQYALGQSLDLLAATPFSDTDAVAVTFNYANENQLRTIGDLRKVAQSLTFGAPPQFQQSPTGLSAIEQAYGFMPAAFTPLDIGGQYQALDQGTVQAADVNSTDGALLTGNYELLKDPRNVLGFGNVVPVVSAKALAAEGPAFAATINKVSALLTTSVMRQLNAAVDVYHQDPGVVAKEFLQAHGLVPLTGS
jgi:osmoprotectant transport system substrate-binding protein